MFWWTCSLKKCHLIFHCSHRAEEKPQLLRNYLITFMLNLNTANFMIVAFSRSVWKAHVILLRFRPLIARIWTPGLYLHRENTCMEHRSIRTKDTCGITKALPDGCCYDTTCLQVLLSFVRYYRRIINAWKNILHIHVFVEENLLSRLSFFFWLVNQHMMVIKHLELFQ